MDSNKILILLFYYNRPQMVVNALKSLNKSTYNNIEIAFIDDGSPNPGKPIAESILDKDLLQKTIFFNTNQTTEQKIKQGGSIFGKFANQAIKNSSSNIALMLCDDDALTPGYLEYLNAYFNLNPDVNHCYSKVLFYDPSKEDYTQSKESTTYNHPGTTYKLNHYDKPINAYCKVDSSQVAWRTKCNIEGKIWFPYPQTRNLDASLFNQLYSQFGFCYPTHYIVQCKGAFEDQLGNRFSENKNEFEISKL